MTYSTRPSSIFGASCARIFSVVFKIRRRSVCSVRIFELEIYPFFMISFHCIQCYLLIALLLIISIFLEFFFSFLFSLPIVSVELIRAHNDWARQNSNTGRSSVESFAASLTNNTGNNASINEDEELEFSAHSSSRSSPFPSFSSEVSASVAKAFAPIKVITDPARLEEIFSVAESRSAAPSVHSSAPRASSDSPANVFFPNRRASPLPSQPFSSGSDSDAALGQSSQSPGQSIVAASRSESNQSPQVSANLLQAVQQFPLVAAHKIQHTVAPFRIPPPPRAFAPKVKPIDPSLLPLVPDRSSRTTPYWQRNRRQRSRPRIDQQQPSSRVAADKSESQMVDSHHSGRRASDASNAFVSALYGDDNENATSVDQDKDSDDEPPPPPVLDEADQAAGASLSEMNVALRARLLAFQMMSSVIESSSAAAGSRTAKPTSTAFHATTASDDSSDDDDSGGGDNSSDAHRRRSASYYEEAMASIDFDMSSRGQSEAPSRKPSMTRRGGGGVTVPLPSSAFASNHTAAAADAAAADAAALDADSQCLPSSISGASSLSLSSTLMVSANRTQHRRRLTVLPSLDELTSVSDFSSSSTSASSCHATSGLTAGSSATSNSLCHQAGSGRRTKSHCRAHSAFELQMSNGAKTRPQSALPSSALGSAISCSADESSNASEYAAQSFVPEKSASLGSMPPAGSRRIIRPNQSLSVNVRYCVRAPVLIHRRHYVSASQDLESAADSASAFVKPQSWGSISRASHTSLQVESFGNRDSVQIRSSPVPHASDLGAADALNSSSLSCSIDQDAAPLDSTFSLAARNAFSSSTPPISFHQRHVRVCSELVTSGRSVLKPHSGVFFHQHSGVPPPADFSLSPPPLPPANTGAAWSLEARLREILLRFVDQHVQRVNSHRVTVTPSSGGQPVIVGTDSKDADTEHSSVAAAEVQTQLSPVAVTPSSGAQPVMLAAAPKDADIEHPFAGPVEVQTQLCSVAVTPLSGAQPVMLGTDSKDADTELSSVAAAEVQTQLSPVAVTPSSGGQPVMLAAAPKDADIEHLFADPAEVQTGDGPSSNAQRSLSISAVSSSIEAPVRIVCKTVSASYGTLLPPSVESIIPATIFKVATAEHFSAGAVEFQSDDGLLHPAHRLQPAATSLIDPPVKVACVTVVVSYGALSRPSIDSVVNVSVCRYCGGQKLQRPVSAANMSLSFKCQCLRFSSVLPIKH